MMATSWAHFGLRIILAGLIVHSCCAANEPAALNAVLTTTKTIGNLLAGLIGDLLCKPLKLVADLTTDLLALSDKLICTVVRAGSELVGHVITFIKNLSVTPVKNASELLIAVELFLDKLGCTTLQPVEILVTGLLQLIKNLVCDRLESVNVIIEKLGGDISKLLPYSSSGALTDDVLKSLRNLVRAVLKLKADLICKPIKSIVELVEDLLMLINNLFCELCPNDVQDIITELLVVVRNLIDEPFTALQSFRTNIQIKINVVFKKFKCRSLDPIDTVIDKILQFIKNLNCKTLITVNNLLEYKPDYLET